VLCTYCNVRMMDMWCCVHMVLCACWIFSVVHIECYVHVVYAVLCTYGVVCMLYMWCYLHMVLCEWLYKWCYEHVVSGTCCTCGVM